MLERGREPRLAQEALPEGLVGGELGDDQLERHGALERELGRPVHDPHPAATDELLDPVARELGPRRQVRRHLVTISTAVEPADPAPVPECV